MGKRKSIIVSLFMISFLLLSCDDIIVDPTDTSSDTITDSTTEPTTSSSTGSTTDSTTTTTQPPLERLLTPVLFLNDARTGVVWDEVSGASSYSVKVNEEIFEDASEHLFSSEIGEYVITVTAIADGVNYLDSEESLPFEYETKDIFLSDLTRVDMSVSWTSISFKTEVKFNNEQYVETTSSTYVASRTGEVSVRVLSGFEEEENIYYVGDTIEKSINVVEVGLGLYMIEDVEGRGNSDLQEDWIPTKYEDNTWKSTAAVASVSYEAFGENNTQSLKLDVWKNGSAFRYSRDIDLAHSYNALSLLVKGDDDVDYTLRFNDIETGIYADYKIDDASSNWVHHHIRFDDPAWAVAYGNNVYNLVQVAETLNYDHPGELVTLFDQFQIIVKGTFVSPGPQTYVLADEIALVNDNTPSRSEMHYDLDGRYTGENASAIYQFSNNGATGVFESLSLEYNYALSVMIETDVNSIKLTSIDDNGKSLYYEGRISHHGDKITYVKVTGTYAFLVADLSLSKVKVLDDFESYEETGVGYDVNHSPLERSGLRGNYYTDYYSGNENNPSPLGGKNWSLVSSTDYLNLETDDVHSGNNAARLKRSSTIRYINYNSYTGKNPGYGGGNSKFSFWAKSPSVDVKLRIRVYYVSQVNASNQVSGGSVSSTVDIVVEGGLDWQQYMMDINSEKIVFGYSFSTVEGATSYPLIDDVELFSANPWVV